MNPQGSFRDPASGHNNAWALNDGVSTEDDDEVQRYRILKDAPKCLDDVFLAVFVHSVSDMVDRRSAIRQTWGKLGLYDLGVRLVFVMGVLSGDEAAEKVVAFESRRYHDIVQESFKDSFGNVTNKALAGLRWVKRACPHAKFVLKTEDTTFVNTPALLNHLWDLTNTGQNQRVLMGRMWWTMHTVRDGSERYTVPKKQYPLDHYPPYCSGMAFIMSIDVAIDILAMAPDVPYLKVADVFITGLVAYKLNIKHTQFDHTYFNHAQLSCFAADTWYKCLFVEIKDQDNFVSTWDTMMISAKKYPIPKVQEIKPGRIAGSMVPDSANVPHVLSSELKAGLDKFLRTD